MRNSKKCKKRAARAGLDLSYNVRSADIFAMLSWDRLIGRRAKHKAQLIFWPGPCILYTALLCPILDRAIHHVNYMKFILFTICLYFILSFREQHSRIEVKRQPFDYNGHPGYGRNGRRRANSEKKSNKIDKLEPLKNEDPSGKNEKRVSFQKLRQNGGQNFEPIICSFSTSVFPFVK